MRMKTASWFPRILWGLMGFSQEYSKELADVIHCKISFNDFLNDLGNLERSQSIAIWLAFSQKKGLLR